MFCRDTVVWRVNMWHDFACTDLFKWGCWSLWWLLSNIFSYNSTYVCVFALGRVKSIFIRYISPFALSQFNHSPPQPSGDAPKSRSLDRKHVEPIVLTKWRHSAYVQDPNDKVWQPSLQTTDLRRAPLLDTKFHNKQKKNLPQKSKFYWFSFHLCTSCDVTCSLVSPESHL